MAVCKFISKIKSVISQSNVINYTKNKNKTHNDGYAQEKAISYTTNEEKTKNENWLHSVYSQDERTTDGEKEFFVTGIMCTKEDAHQRMMKAQQMSDKPIVNLAYHAVQSFAEGANDLTPETAHEIGVRLARELWGDEFMVLISTHLNTDHYHNHFIICSTSPITGKRFHECPAAWRAMCDKSDELCREYGLNTLDHAPMKTRKKSGSEIAMEKKGIPTHRDILKNDCDIAIAQANSWNDFLSNLRKMGYRIHTSNKFINITADGWERTIRIYFDSGSKRSLGLDYTKPAIERRIAEKNRTNSKVSVSDIEPVFDDDESEFDYRCEQSRKTQPITHYLPRTDDECRNVNILPNVSHAKYRGSVRSAKGKPMNLRITYYRITYKLCVVSMPGRPRRKRRMSVYMQKEVDKLNLYLDEIRFLHRTGIQTVGGIQIYKSHAAEQMEDLCRQRQSLRYKLRSCKSRDDEIPIRSEISQLTADISSLRKELKMCDDIIANSDNVKAAADIDTRKELERCKEYSDDTKTKQTITTDKRKE